VVFFDLLMEYSKARKAIALKDLHLTDHSEEECIRQMSAYPDFTEHFT